jgi:uncharacterized protein YutE (UPF0331/DUF86 family)
MRAGLIHDKLSLIAQLRAWIDALPLADRDDFLADPMPAAAAESYVRRSLEALFDLGRHVLAKAFGDDAGEYKSVAARLGDHGVLDAEVTALMIQMAGYRNRLVLFYHDVTAEELYVLCTAEVGDIQRVARAIDEWIGTHPELVDISA